MHACKANATINHRIHPCDTLEKVLEYDKDVIDNSSIPHIAFEPKSQLEFSF